MILLVASPSVTDSELLNSILTPSLCVYHSVCPTPVPFLSSLTLTKTYCSRTCQPVLIIALCVAVTSTLSVYVTDSVSNQVQPLCPQRATVQEDLLRHYSSIHPCLPASALVHKLLHLPKRTVLSHSFNIQKNLLMRSTQKVTNATADVCRIKLWRCSFM